MSIEAVQWERGRLRILDQTRLPGETVFLELERWQEAVEAIQALRVRGAPALGVAGAYALVLAAQEYAGGGRERFQGELAHAAHQIARARPTAVNLAWAVDRALAAAADAPTPQDAIRRLLAEADAIRREDVAANKRIGEYGAALIPQHATILTHCNTGSLATAGVGTALGVVRTAWAQHKLDRVIATETRPLLQGARLTTWELEQDGIPVTLVVDGAAGLLMQREEISAVVVGADRIAANGDVANKVGTYSLAVLARSHGVPFYVAAPTTTVDLGTPSGADIPIEERGPEEVSSFAGVVTAPPGVTVFNPAFDVTPAELVGAIVTEEGVVKAPYEMGLKKVKGHHGA
jgi:methylthioribose-1-phosphate isomerase